MRWNKKILVILVGAILLIISISGCLAIEEHVKVSKDGTIKEFKISMNMSKELYLMMLENSTSNSLCEDFSKEKEQVEATCEERVSGDRAIIVLTARNVKPEDSSWNTTKSIRIYKEGDYLIYEDYTWFEEGKNEDFGEFGNLITLDYYLEMPGKIVDSNANIVKENKAEWHMNGNQMGKVKIYAKSEIPKGICGPALILGLALLPLLFRKDKRV